jgi:hypothetical protein
MTPAPGEAQLYLKIGDSFIPVPWDIYPASLKEAAHSIERGIETDRRYWHSRIQDESERLRFNQGYEPVSVDLYPSTRSSILQGQTQVGHARFNVTARWKRDKNEVKVLHLEILRAA